MPSKGRVAQAAAPAKPDAPIAAAGPAPWETARWGLAAAERLLAVQLVDVLPTLIELVAEVSPTRTPTMALLTGDCPRSPLQTSGAAGNDVTTGEMAELAARLDIGDHWHGRARLAGVDQPIVALRVAPGSPVGSLFVVAVADDLSPTAVEAIVGTLRVAATTYAWSALSADPRRVGSSMVVAAERARIAAELTEQHEAALSTILAALRAAGRSDAAARSTATDAAVAALLDVRRAADAQRELVEEPADEAFERLTQQLVSITRGTVVRFEHAPPQSDRALPSELAHAARAVSRNALIALLAAGEPQRVRVAWAITDDRLELELRDDSSSATAELDLERGRVTERVHAVGGTLRVDTVPGWGTTIRASLPLIPATPESVQASPLAVLAAREREVLDQLALGRRNREIAEALVLSENTVKFHVANILKKLDVRTRGEAAALARENDQRAASPALRVV